MKDEQIMKDEKSSIEDPDIAIEAAEIESQESGDHAKITTVLEESSTVPACNLYLETMNVVEHQIPIQRWRNRMKFKPNSWTTRLQRFTNASIDDLKALQPTTNITQDSDGIKIGDSDAIQSAETEELKKQETVPECYMPLEGTNLLSDFPDKVLTGFPCELALLIINVAAKIEARDDLKMDKEIKEQGIDAVAGNIKEGLIQGCAFRANRFCHSSQILRQN